MNDEPRYTKKEWKQKQSDDSFVSRVRHALIGRRGVSIEVLNRIMNEIQIVTEPDVFKSYILGVCIAINTRDEEDAPV